MNPITALFKEFERSSERRNPSPRTKEDDISRFLRFLSATDELETWSEAEWIDFGQREGMDDQEIVELVEQAAGWVEDTSGERGEPETAAWTGL